MNEALTLHTYIFLFQAGPIRLFLIFCHNVLCIIHNSDNYIFPKNFPSAKKQNRLTDGLNSAMLGVLLHVYYVGFDQYTVLPSCWNAPINMIYNMFIDEFSLYVMFEKTNVSLFLQRKSCLQKHSISNAS